MEKKLTVKTVFLFILLSTSSLVVAKPTESWYLSKIKAVQHQPTALKKYSTNFFKDYPRSNAVADVRFLLAENDSNHQEALKQYQLIVSHYRYFSQRELAALRACELLELKGLWANLQNYALWCVRTFPQSKYAEEYRYFLALSAYKNSNYNLAQKAGRDLAQHSRHRQTQEFGKLVSANVILRTQGYSFAYFQEITQKQKKSQLKPQDLYKLCDYFLTTKEFAKAHSVYDDLTHKYPHSPESLLAQENFQKKFKNNHYGNVNYLEKTPKLEEKSFADLSPEIEPAVSQNAVSYIVSLGPFYNLKQAEQLKKTLEKDFLIVQIVSLKNGYFIYVGRFPQINQAQMCKIRLAEEFALRGNVLRLFIQNGQAYVYTD